MSKLAAKGIYDVSPNHKKQISLKVNFPYGIKYFTNLKLIYESTSEIEIEKTEENLNYQAVSEKLYCNACNIKFSDYKEMRRHQWMRTHRIKSGLITDYNKNVLSDENEESEDNDDDDVDDNLFDEKLFEEELEVDNDIEDNQESDEEINFNEVISKENNTITNFTNYDYISALKTGKISFNEVCSFPTVYFQNSNNEIIGIKRCLLFNKKNKPENQQQLMNYVNNLLTCRKFAVLLYSGGCFAGAIFEGEKKILHKSFKRYTYRRQQGGSQTTKDNQGGNCKSGGAYLRRVNTKKLLDDVFQLLHQTWAEEIDNCNLILVWSAKSQRHIFGHAGMFNQHRNQLSFDVSTDPRVRFISARVSKVNSTTLLDVYRQISTIEIYDSGSITSFIQKETPNGDSDEKAILNEQKPSKKKSKKKNKEKVENGECKIRIEDSREEENDKIVDVVPQNKEEDEIRTKLLNYVLNDSAEDLEPYLKELKLNKSAEHISQLLSTPLKTRNQSLLHLAVSHSNIQVIAHLLAAGCDPLHRNVDNETPYAQAIRQRNKVMCNAMSEYMFRNPNQYDYHAAKFPGGKDPLKEEQKRKQLSDKKKQYKKDRKQRMKLEEEERKKEEFEKSQRDQFLSLDNKSKINHLKLVEKNQKKRFLLCFQCAIDISDVVPFSYSDFSFCGMDCLKNHRILNEK